MYVHLTSHVQPGTPLFVSLHPPFAPLSANSIGRITRKLLLSLGIPMSVFGPHSTRGAAVKMYKRLGLSSEMVCELGGWKNTQAFAAHYLRLGASEQAAEVINRLLVHNDPSCYSEEQDRSCSPGTAPDLGRSDLSYESCKHDGPTPPAQENEEERHGQKGEGGLAIGIPLHDLDNCRRSTSKGHPRASYPHF